MKAVKKLCLDSGFGLGAQVRDWESRASPVARRIVTRSNTDQDGTDGLVALSDDEDAEDIREDIKVEIINQDGSVEVPAADEAIDDENHEWSDVEGGEEGEGTYDDTLMHLGEAVNHTIDLSGNENDPAEPEDATTTVNNRESAQEESPLDLGSIGHADIPANNVTDNPESTHHLPTPSPNTHSPHNSTQGTTVRSPPGNVILPQGFVSPAVRRRRSIKQARLLSASRRNTLPVNFTAATLPTQVSRDESRSIHVTESIGNATSITEISVEDVKDSDVQGTGVADDGLTGDAPDETAGDEGEWEDIETSDPGDKDATGREREEANEHLSHGPHSPAPTEDGGDISPRRIADQSLVSTRRSPRRKSSSPMKQSTIWSDLERSHLIAFTPVKLPASPLSAIHSGDATCSPVTGTPQAINLTADEQPSPWTRASSAPPEEPRISPHKARQPRISDDTALLQAFLNRAAESRSSRRLSETARRESLENRRDSDSVRRALASTDVVATVTPTAAPTPPTVLMDLDPNSPSPRKITPATETRDPATEAKPDDSIEDHDDTTPDPSSRRPSSRRSGRVRKKEAETLEATTYTAPNKISIRGNADCVVLKRSEAQELALLTRNNTRKNKGGSVLPPLRLTKMAKDLLTDEGEDTKVDMKRDAKSVQWAETLTAYRRYSAEAEESLADDESTHTGPADTAQDIDVEMADTATTATAASETPGRPKPRRVKPTRVAMVPVPVPDIQTPSVTFETPAPEPEPEETARPRAPKRRSRIATPAKVKGKSLLSLSDEPEEAPKVSNHPPSQRVASKLPAPIGIASTSSSSGSAFGKEGSLISSPPKKRLRPATGSVPTKPGKGAPVSRLDLTKPTVNFDVGHSAAFDPSAVPGLASPAKKRSGALPPSGGDETSVPSLGSPAKKRTRRAIR